MQRCISRIILFINTAVSINDSLDPGPQALAGLRHGVPVEGPHHLLYLLDQILGIVARLCNDPYFRFAQHKMAKRFPLGELGGQTSSSYTSATVLLMVFAKDFNLYHGTSGTKSGDCPCSCAYLLIHLCWNVTVSFYLCFSRQLRRFCGKKLLKNIIATVKHWKFPEISLPPCNNCPVAPPPPPTKKTRRYLVLLPITSCV